MPVHPSESPAEPHIVTLTVPLICIRIFGPRLIGWDGRCGRASPVGRSRSAALISKRLVSVETCGRGWCLGKRLLTSRGRGSTDREGR
jgi:hypothetical protein